jgi:hypothetical protein
MLEYVSSLRLLRLHVLELLRNTPIETKHLIGKVANSISTICPERSVGLAHFPFFAPFAGFARTEANDEGVLLLVRLQF